jgi:hypothetical protein
VTVEEAATLLDLSLDRRDDADEPGGALGATLARSGAVAAGSPDEAMRAE